MRMPGASFEQLPVIRVGKGMRMPGASFEQLPVISDAPRVRRRAVWGVYYERDTTTALYCRENEFRNTQLMQKVYISSLMLLSTIFSHKMSLLQSEHIGPAYSPTLLRIWEHLHSCHPLLSCKSIWTAA